MTQWFDEAFRSDYLTLYKHRSDEQAASEVNWLMKLLAPSRGTAVLDLCCGNGRHSVAMATHGLEVIGVDRSLDLLMTASARANEGPRWVAGDMRALPFGQAFDLITNLFSSFGYFDDPSDDKRVIDEMSRVLNPGGTAVIDFLNATLVRETLVPKSHDQQSGWTITQTRRLTDEGQRVEKDVKMVHQSGNQRCWTERIWLHDMESFQGLLAESRLELLEVYGSMEGGAYSGESERMVLVLRNTP